MIDVIGKCRLKCLKKKQNFKRRLILGLIKRLFRSCEIVKIENRAGQQN
jgi:hypothetical protein